MLNVEEKRVRCTFPIEQLGQDIRILFVVNGQ